MAEEAMRSSLSKLAAWQPLAREGPRPRAQTWIDWLDAVSVYLCVIRGFDERSSLDATVASFCST